MPGQPEAGCPFFVFPPGCPARPAVVAGFSPKPGKMEALRLDLDSQRVSLRMKRNGESMNRTASMFLLLCGLLLALRASPSFATGPEASKLFGIAKVVVGTDSIEVTQDASLDRLELIPGAHWSTDGVKSLT